MTCPRGRRTSGVHHWSAKMMCRKGLLLALALIVGCETSPSSPPKTESPRKARVEVIGAGGTCLKCGEDFTVSPDEEGNMVLTPVCPKCQAKK